MDTKKEHFSWTFSKYMNVAFVHSKKMHEKGHQSHIEFDKVLRIINKHKTEGYVHEVDRHCNVAEELQRECPHFAASVLSMLMLADCTEGRRPF